MTALTLNQFETTLAQLKNKAPTLKYVVLNCTRSCSAVVDQIRGEIGMAKPNQQLFGLDLRVIIHPTGNPQNWSVEACDSEKSLAVIGESPTA